MNDIDFLMTLIEVDTKNGKIFWKFRNRDLFKSDGYFKCWNSKHAGEEAGTISKDGYVYLNCKLIKKKRWLRTHLIWFKAYNELPKNEIDHINRNRIDDRLENLRDVPRSINARNKSKSKYNTSGYNGVRLFKNGKVQARVKLYGKEITLYYGEDIQEAIKIRKEWDKNNDYTDDHGT